MTTKYTLLLFFTALMASCQSGFFAKKTVKEPADAPISVNKPTPEEDLKGKPMAPMSSEAIFDQLVAKTEDGQVKKDLLAYKAEGNIAKKVDMKGATPDDLINTAREYLGTPHKMGGTSKKGIDCSGLLHVVFSKYNIDLPHNSHEISRFGKMVANKKDLQKGDLVFFIRTYKTHHFITHSGIYIGDGKFIHASSQKGVILSDVNDPYYWSKHYIFAKRLF